MTDLSTYADTPVSPARSIRAVTPNNGADLPSGPCKSLMVLEGGNLQIVAAKDADGSHVTIPVSAGWIVPVVVRRVMAANTTATVLALY